MRVLWFATKASCYLSVNKEGKYTGYNGGGWMSSLQQEIVKQENVNLGICFCKDNEPQKIEQNGVMYYPIANHCKTFKNKILDLIYYKDVHRDEVLWPYYIEQFKRVIRDFNPDVIQVFGSELYIGLATLAAKESNIPCVLHIQGLLSLYIYIYLPTGVSKWKYFLSEGLKGAYSKFQYLAYWNRSCHREKAILQAVPHVIGRTDWDKQAMSILNPQAEYHYGGEILRDCFYEWSERNIPECNVITTTSSGASYKGFDLVLKIANILKNECHINFEWKVYGNVNPSFFEHLTGINHECVNVKLCGVASAEQLRESMLNCTLYVQPSYIENSPNSIAEAHMLGVPVVATNVGGTSSMLEHYKSGFLFPSTDPYMGAYFIRKLIEDKKLNVRMGKKGKEIAFIRHNKRKIIEDLLHTYMKIVEEKENTCKLGKRT